MTICAIYLIMVFFGSAILLVCDVAEFLVLCMGLYSSLFFCKRGTS
jgi:hypothetical protein